MRGGGATIGGGEDGVKETADRVARHQSDYCAKVEHDYFPIRIANFCSQPWFGRGLSVVFLCFLFIFAL